LVWVVGFAGQVPESPPDEVAPLDEVDAPDDPLETPDDVLLEASSPEELPPDDDPPLDPP
jgi:hypothetical protein